MSGATDIGALGLAFSLLAVALAAVASWRLGLRLERDIVGACTRALVQMLIAGAALGLVIGDDAPLALSWLWVAGIVVYASVAIQRRAPELPGVLPIAFVSTTATAAVGLGIAFGTGIFPVEGKTVVPVAAMLVGNALKTGIVAATLLRDEMSGRRDELEARLALGLSGSASSAPIVRRVLRTAMSPQIENIRGLGIVFLPGAMTGLILAGVDPLDAVLVQLALMYLILGAVVVTTVVITLGARSRLFTGDHRLVPLARAMRDE